MDAGWCSLQLSCKHKPSDLVHDTACLSTQACDDIFLFDCRVRNSTKLTAFEASLMRHAAVPAAVADVVAAMPNGSHPMACIMAGLTTLGACFPDQNPALAGMAVYVSREVQDLQIACIIAKVSQENVSCLQAVACQMCSLLLQARPVFNAEAYVLLRKREWLERAHADRLSAF